MEEIKFGPAGNSDSFYAEGHKHTHEAPEWLHNRGLNAFEYSFGRGVKLKEETGNKIQINAQEYGITVSVHAPYYINLANEEFEKNLAYFAESSKAGEYMGAKRVVFHPGSVGKMTRERAFARVKDNLIKIIDEVTKLGFRDMVYCPETMGKINQIGTLEEVYELCGLDERIYPAIDFGHLNARTLGGIKTKKDYETILDTLKNACGEEKYKNMHVHFSHIQYTDMGEKMHLTFEDEEWGPFFEPLGELIAERGLTPIIICESKGTQAEDALEMKKMCEEDQ